MVIKSNIHDTMKLKTSIIVCLLGFIGYGYSCTNNIKAKNSPDWLPISLEVQESIVNDYVKALDEYAQVMPYFADDTEAQWAADKVHAMAMSLKQNQCSFLQKLATISQMQNYTGYGMAYFNAMICVYKEPEATNVVFQIIPKSDSIYSYLKETKFEDVRSMSVFNIRSIQNMQLFHTINLINNDLDEDKDKEFWNIIYAVWAMDSIACIEEYSDNDVYKISAILESYSFFQMVCPLLKLFSGTTGKLYSHIDMVTEAANHIDSQSAPIFQSVEKGEKVEVMNDFEFEKWIISATKYKVKLLTLLTKFIKEWEQSENSEEN